MPDLREKVLAMADAAAYECGMEQGSQDHEYIRAQYAALAALVAEECARECEEPKLTCCGQPDIGAEYMGQQEMICCGNAEPDDLTAAECAAAIRQRAETLK